MRAKTAQLPEVTERKTAFNQTSDNDFESAYSISFSSQVHFKTYQFTA